MSWLEDARVSGVFVDSSAYHAYVDRNDRRHAAVNTLFEQLLSAGIRLYTTNILVAESHALVLNRMHRRIAATLLGKIDENPLTTVVRVTEEDDQRARQIIWRYDDKDFTLADALSFAVMERLGISYALTLDHHFAQYGWIMLPTSE